jgi:hypothetical protein
MLVVIVAGSGDDGVTDQSNDAAPIRYRVASIEGKLVRELDESSERLAEGDQLQSGDRLRTGWFSEAEIVAPDWAATFRMAPRTRVRLAGERPGLLLEVGQGRVRATFNPMPVGAAAAEPEAEAGAPVERIITTPSVILAVRGTDYSVAVDDDGNTTVAVFTGTVEAVDIAQSGEPVLVDEGYSCTIRRGQQPEAPRRHRWRARQWSKIGMPGGQRRGQEGESAGSHQGGGQQQRRRGGGGSSRHGG